ncbi:hypothetical protein PO587_38850 [Streptomyces gilvifuscus]|uniref:MarR family transcriptional regulator n=1 Tax=Streptomyces gilvifuscus TaxID=1550617 RepID=A0ABT5G6P6_9ACTN|nr:hypothetical protein [Streptomyces gilvifuscus]MDC2960400.1 hypothetical protein [Streptomyces gilvifuscus]
MPSLEASSARSAALAHLADHARADALPPHLRTCQCRERGCCWHPRHRGCAGPVLLALTRDRSGRTWRLADTCAACTAATSHTAIVPDTLCSPHPTSASARARRPQTDDEHRQQVREMLTYLASALPRVTSPAARLLAMQCALRASRHGCARLPAGLLRGMRLHRRPEVWQELTHSGWLHLPDPRAANLQVRLLDHAVLDQAPTPRARKRAAHWALQPSPCAPTAVAAPAERLTALALAAHATATTPAPELATLAHLCGHSPQQTGELLDRLVARRALSAWSHHRETDEVHWRPASPPPGAA